MDVRIEVAAAEAVCEMVVPSIVKVILGICKVAISHVEGVATSILRSITAFGSTSLSAVSPDANFTNGGVATA